MADQTTTQLAGISSLDDNDILMVVEDGTAKKVTIAELRAALLWETVFSESGASLANWTQDSGSWSVVSSAFQVNTTGGTIARLKYNTAVTDHQTGLWMLQVEIKMDSAGIASDAPAGLLFLWDGAGSGDPTVQLFKAGAGAGTKQIRSEQDFASARIDAFTPSPTWALDAWHKLTVVGFGTAHTVLLDGVFVAGTSGNLGAGAGQDPGDYGLTAARFVGLIANNAVVNFRNIVMKKMSVAT